MYTSLVPLLLSLLLAALVAVPVVHVRITRAQRRAEADVDPGRAGPYRTAAPRPPPPEPPARPARTNAGFAGLVALQFLAPGLVAGLLVLPSSMASAFAPCAVAAFALWCWGPLLVTRAKDAASTERLGAIVSLLIGSALLVPPLAHALVVELAWIAGKPHHCAACPAVWMILAYAVFTITHALLMLSAVHDDDEIDDEGGS